MYEPLDSKQLRAFVLLARSGSFTDTAHELNLTQSAISRSIQALEESVGCRLLDRKGKSVVPTPAGEQLLLRAEPILHAMQQSRTELIGLGKWGTTRLRIGASSTACQHVFPEVLKAFKESFPQCAITIKPGDTNEDLEALRDHLIDLAVCLEPEGDVAVDFHPLFTDELHFIVNPEHPWASAGKVTRSQIVKQHYILYGRKSYTFRMIEDYFHEEKIELRSFLELANMAAIKEMVKLNLGVSIMALWTTQQEIADGTLVALPLGRKKLKRKWGILNARGRHLSAAEEAFVAFCKVACKRLGMD